MKSPNKLFKRIATHHPDAPALTDGANTHLTYANLLCTILETQAALERFGVTGIAVVGDNSVAQVVLDIACLNAGIWTLQIPPFFTADQIAHALRETGCCHVMSDSPFDCLGQPRGSGDSIAIAGRQMYLTRLQRAPRSDQVLAGTAKVTFTSGSTAQPKGLCLSAEHLLAPVTALAAELSPLALTRHLAVLPQAVLLETVAGIYTTLYLGACCVIPSLTETSVAADVGGALYRSLAVHQASTAILVPELLQQLVGQCELADSCPEFLRFVAVGGSRVSKGLLCRAADSGLPVHEGYGLSEAGSVVTLNLPHCNKPGSVGRVLPHQHISIAGNGEIILGRRGFIGYCGTVEKLDSCGGFATGDSGLIDEDGFLHVNGRMKDILITSMGRNVAPEWVESVLLDQSAISQVLVYGDAQAALSAVIVSTESTDRVQSAVNLANLSLPAYARVRQWQYVPAFTVEQGFLTANGKLKRQLILDSLKPDVHYAATIERRDTT